ncbi:MAG: sulfite exporter TauE/SafE family protein [Pseudomonadota bacterium]
MADNRNGQGPIASTHANTPRDYAEIGAAFVVIAGVLFILNQLDFLPQNFAVSDDMSIALVFVIGLVASISTCMAVTGGLLVAVAAKYNEATGTLTSAQRLKPHLYFNAGRIISYTLLGGAIGALGSTLTLSPGVNGVLTIAASAVMILLGLQMLKLLPSLTRFIPTMPKVFSHRIHDLAERKTKGGAFALGAATFFLPCGFTQALQLYVLAKASFTTGALTMLAFSLGTLPALLSLSAMSSFATGTFQKHFLKFAGAAIVALGVLNIQYGLVLTNMSAAPVASNAVPPSPAAASSPPVERQTEATSKQVVVMRIVGFSYIPNRFTVTQGVPVEWRIDASEAAGCGRILLAPRLGVRRLLSDNSTTTIAFTPQETGEFGFNCGMGMMTPNSKFIVVAKANG